MTVAYLQLNFCFYLMFNVSVLQILHLVKRLSFVATTHNVLTYSLAVILKKTVWMVVMNFTVVRNTINLLSFCAF